MKRVMFVMVLCLAALSGTAAAQTLGRQQVEEKYLRIPHRFQILVEGGTALPTDPGMFNDYWNSSFQFGIGFGVSIFPWFEVNASYGGASFAVKAIDSKTVIDYQGTGSIEGGTISTTIFAGTARFIAVPKARTNPFIELSVGTFSTKADRLFIEGEFSNEMEEVSGIMVAPGLGIQYAMNERWGAYARYSYTINLNEDFAPGDLLLSPGEEPTVGGNQIITSLMIGLMYRI